MSRFFFVRSMLLFLLVDFCCFWRVHFIMNDFVYFIDLNVITLNRRHFIMTFLFDWIS